MIEFIRAIVRPALAMGAMGGTIYFVALTMRTGVPIPDGWWPIVTGAMVFYFTQRHEEKRNGSAQ